jgi:hypothetical protein
MAETKVVGGVPTGTSFGVPGSELIIDPTFGAARVKLSPNEFMNQGIVGGHYLAAPVSGALTGVAAAGPVFSFRWSPSQGASPYALIKRIQLGWATTTAFTAQQALTFSGVRATAFTVADTGGTAYAPFATGTQKMRTGLMSPSVVADFRMATTGALTAGTRTFDTLPFGYVTGIGPITTVTATPLVDLYSETTTSQHPLILAANEGFEILNVIAMGAAGVINLYVVVSWAEVPGL